MSIKVPIEISARHVHLSKKDLEKLFGKNYQLKILHKISQPGQFAAKEEVFLINGKNKIQARILGPIRKETQVEISITDDYRLKMKKIPPIKISGNGNNTSKIEIKGPKGRVNGRVIIAKRHLHLSDSDAEKLKLKNNQIIKIEAGKERKVIFDNVIVRTGKEHKFAFQIDVDEGNSAGISGKYKNFGRIVK